MIPVISLSNHIEQDLSLPICQSWDGEEVFGSFHIMKDISGELWSKTSFTFNFILVFMTCHIVWGLDSPDEWKENFNILSVQQR